MNEAHVIVTEYDRRFHWWCSCGFDTDSHIRLHQHLETKEARP